MKKSFDAVAFMRKRREELSREYEGLSRQERERKMAEALKDDPLWHRLENRIVPSLTRQLSTVREPETKYGKPGN